MILVSFIINVFAQKVNDAMFAIRIRKEKRKPSWRYCYKSINVAHAE